MSDSSDLQDQYDRLRERIVGLGEQSIRKSYYPELQRRIANLEQFRLMLDQSSDAVLLLSVPSGRILECNETARREFDQSRDALRTQTIFDLVAAPAGGQVRTLFSDAEGGNHRSETFLSVFAAGDGRMFPIEVSLKTVRLGQMLLAVADVRNISARLSAEKELRMSEERYRTLFEDSRDAIYIISPSGDFVDINQAGVEMLGYRTKEDVLRLNMDRNVCATPEEQLRVADQFSASGYLKDFEVLFRKRNGEQMNVLLTSSVMHDERGTITGYRGIMRDITDHKKLEQQLLQAQKMEAVGRLTAGIAHDFNNILTAILGYATMFELKITEDDTLKHYIRNLVVSAERAAALIKHLLSFSRQQKLSMTHMDANALVVTMRDFLAGIIGEKISFSVETAGQTLVINADKIQMEQVLMNLVTNAIDAMPQGGNLHVGCVRFLMDTDFVHRHGYGKSGEYVCLSVADTGTGMDQDTQQKLFEPFFTTKEVGKGTGLGLSIAYGIIKQHGGYVSVESAPGQGTTFRIYLPLVTSKEEMSKDQGSPG